jgi:hypothetical protein
MAPGAGLNIKFLHIRSGCPQSDCREVASLPLGDETPVLPRSGVFYCQSISKFL